MAKKFLNITLAPGHYHPTNPGETIPGLDLGKFVRDIMNKAGYPDNCACKPSCTESCVTSPLNLLQQELDELKSRLLELEENTSPNVVVTECDGIIVTPTVVNDITEYCVSIDQDWLDDYINNLIPEVPEAECYSVMEDITTSSAMNSVMNIFQKGEGIFDPISDGGTIQRIEITENIIGGTTATFRFLQDDGLGSYIADTGMNDYLNHMRARLTSLGYTYDDVNFEIDDGTGTHRAYINIVNINIPLNDYQVTSIDFSLFNALDVSNTAVSLAVGTGFPAGFVTSAGTPTTVTEEACYERQLDGSYTGNQTFIDADALMTAFPEAIISDCCTQVTPPSPTFDIIFSIDGTNPIGWDGSNYTEQCFSV